MTREEIDRIVDRLMKRGIIDWLTLAGLRGFRSYPSCPPGLHPKKGCAKARCEVCKDCKVCWREYLIRYTGREVSL
jgi:hypothetical protein